MLPNNTDLFLQCILLFCSPLLLVGQESHQRLRPYFEPSTKEENHWSPSIYQRSPLHPSFPAIPPGGATRVLPDGRVVTITPFTEEQKRQIRQREAHRAKMKVIREREMAQQGPNKSLYPRLPGEYEKQKAILLSISDWQPFHMGVLVELIEKSRGHAELVIAYNDRNQHDGRPQLPELIKLLMKSGDDFPHLRFLNLNLNTVWLRDFGPRLAETRAGNAMAINFFYDTVRPLDDDFPETWSKLTRCGT